MAQEQAGSMRACPFVDGSQGGRSPGVSDKNLEDEDLSDELCPGTWLGVPLVKLPANTPAAMCAMAGNGTVWVLDRHVVLNEDCES